MARRKFFDVRQCFCFELQGGEAYQSLVSEVRHPTLIVDQDDCISSLSVVSIDTFRTCLSDTASNQKSEVVVSTVFERET